MTNFHPIDEKQVTRAIVEEFIQEFLGIIESDVIMVGQAVLLLQRN
jgi:ribulose 1,5-bisphosphate synthetase/thiazole synthase